jgi:hypothetical protein
MNKVNFKIFSIALAIVAFMMPISLLAQSIKVQAPAQVVQGQRFAVTFRLADLEGSMSSGPELKNCRLLYGPSVSTMQSTQIINGQVSTSASRDYSFYYVADKAGSVTVPSMSVTSGGKTYSSNAVTITVLPPDKNAQQQSAQNSGAPAMAQSYDEGDVQIKPEDFIVTVNLSKNHLYEQEAVIATIKIYTKHNITGFQPTTLPTFNGFLSEELPVSQNIAMEHFRGSNYYTAILKKCLLYPQKSGKLTINSGRYDVTLETYKRVSNGFFISSVPVEKKITTTSNSVTVNVEALPEPRPAGFSGAVGSFTATRTLEPELLRTNDVATLKLTITGTGNIKNLAVPEISFPPTVECYTPTSNCDASFNGSDMSGKFTAEYSFIPQQVGQLDIPAQNFVYFDLASKSYKTIDLKGYDKKVIKGSDNVSATQQSVTDKTMDDILYIKASKPSELSIDRKYIWGSTGYIIAYIVVIAALLSAIIIYRRQLKLNADIEGRKTSRANRVANKRLKAARQAMNSKQNELFYQLLAQAIFGYIGDKLRIPASALTRDNIKDSLENYGVAQTTADRLVSIIDECEMARFTPQHSDSEVSELYNATVEVIKNIESVKKH